MTSGPAPRPARRPTLTWLWILVPTVAAAAMLLIVSITVFVQRAVPPIDATYDFLDAVEDDRPADAYEQLCEEDRDRITRSELAETIGRVRSHSYSVFFVNRDGNDARVDVSFGSGSSTENQTFHLRREGGAWKVCDLDTELVDTTLRYDSLR